MVRSPGKSDRDPRTINTLSPTCGPRARGRAIDAGKTFFTRPATLMSPKKNIIFPGGNFSINMPILWSGMGTVPHKISGSLSPQDFPDIWKNERPLPRANLDLRAVLQSLVQDVDMRFRFLEYLHVLKTEYAWDGDKCRAAQGYLALLRNGLREAESWKRSGDRLWRGAIGISAGLLAYAGYRVTQDDPFGTADWAAVIAPAPLVFGAGLARALSAWVHHEIAIDIQKLEDDINWRCMPHEIFELMVGLAVRTDPAADGVNFVALPPVVNGPGPRPTWGLPSPVIRSMAS